MTAIETVVMVLTISFVLAVFGVRIYKYLTHKMVDDCGCHKTNLKKWYYKTYKKRYCSCHNRNK